MTFNVSTLYLMDRHATKLSNFKVA